MVKLFAFESPQMCSDSLQAPKCSASFTSVKLNLWSFEMLSCSLTCTRSPTLFTYTPYINPSPACMFVFVCVGVEDNPDTWRQCLVGGCWGFGQTEPDQTGLIHSWIQDLPDYSYTVMLTYRRLSYMLIIIFT